MLLQSPDVTSRIDKFTFCAGDAFSACGLHDNNVEHAVESYLQQNAERQMVIAQNSQQETMWSVAMTVTPLTADVYEVTCSVVE